MFRQKDKIIKNLIKRLFPSNSDKTVYFNLHTLIAPNYMNEDYHCSLRVCAKKIDKKPII